LKEIRWHGRGGQGVVTVSQMLAFAALLEEKYIQAFPEFGPERTGAPVLGFTRIDDNPIDVHSQVYEPDVVVVIDPTLLESINVAEGLRSGGQLIVNTKMPPANLRKQTGDRNIQIFTINATRIALDILGRPIFNTAMLGALVKVANLVSIESVAKVTMDRFPKPIGEKNVAVIKRAYEEVKAE